MSKCGNFRIYIALAFYAEISEYLLHWHSISFTVTNTHDRVTFLLQNSKFSHLSVSRIQSSLPHCLSNSSFKGLCRST